MARRAAPVLIRSIKCDQCLPFPASDCMSQMSTLQPATLSSCLAAPVSKYSVHAEVYDATIKNDRPAEPVLLHAGYLNGEAKVGNVLPSC